MNNVQKLSVACALALVLLALGAPLLAAPNADAAPVSAVRVQQPQPTVGPTPTLPVAWRERIEAPPLRPQAAALLIGANLALGVGVVLFALLLRRRKRS